MRYLFKGMVEKEKLNLLLSLTNIKSESMINALHVYLVDGISAPRAAARFEIDLSNFHKAIKQLNNKQRVVEKIKEIEFSKNMVS